MHLLYNRTALYFVFFLYTVDFFDIFCIHCDRMAQEVLVLAIVKTNKKKSVLLLIRVHSSSFFGFFFFFFLCPADCTVCFGTRIQPNPVPSHLADQTQYGREWSRFIFKSS